MKPLNRYTHQALTLRPERVIQFGEGNFLRAFVDWIIQRMNQEMNFDSSVAVVQPIAQGLGDIVNPGKGNGLYHLILEGMENGEAKRSDRELIDCITRCINPYSEYEAYQTLVESPDARFVVSNTTEAGIQWADGETLDMSPQPLSPEK